MGPATFRTSTDTHNSTSSAFSNFDEHRGLRHGRIMGWKYFTYGKDRAICLKDGKYQIRTQTIKKINNTWHCNIEVNDAVVLQGHSTNIDHDTIHNTVTIPLKRYDWVKIKGGWYGTDTYSSYEIVRID